MSNLKNGNKCRDSLRLASALESQHGQAVSLYMVEGTIATALRQWRFITLILATNGFLLPRDYMTQEASLVMWSMKTKSIVLVDGVCPRSSVMIM